MLKRYLFCVAFLVAYSSQLYAQTTLSLFSLTERTGSNAQNGSLFADGFADYLYLLNQRDDGIGGARIDLQECETAGKNTAIRRCYESARKHDALAISTSSLAELHTLTVNANTDKIPFLTAGQGLSVSARGQHFPWTFVYPTTPWSQLSAILGYINSVTELRGQTIGFLFPDTRFGNEPLSLLEAFSAAFEFEIAQYPTREQDLHDQSLQWFHIRKGQPDWIIIWDNGLMSTVAIKHAVNIRFPKDRIVGNAVLSSHANFATLGKKANGYLTVNYVAMGQRFPVIQQILKNVVDAGISRVSSRDLVGSVYYNRGVLSAVILSEAIKIAQAKTGDGQIRRTDMRYGLENVRIDNAKLSELGLSGLTSEIIGSCSDHEGGSVYIQQWNGTDWQQRSEYIEPTSSLARSLLEEVAVAFASENPGWDRPTCP
jgi:branched-chain amino acid transport system substrate-binding protein